MKKRILSMMLALCMLITLVPMIAAASSFPDMPDDYSTAALEAAVENGLLTGSDGKILPNDNLTRAQMAAIVVRAFGASNEASLASFSDVSGDEWYASYLAKAVHMKVLQGDGTRLMPNDSITRQQAFTILARALKLEDGTLADLSAFSDASNVASWAVGPTAAMVKAGFIHGAGGKLNLTANILRKDFAVMMHNIFKTYITQPGTVSALAEGCVLINVPGVTLKDVTVKGDLVIGDGVGSGDVILDNVTVTGRMVVRGGGVNSIIIRGGSSVGTVIVSKVDGKVRVYVEGDADVEVVYIDDGNDDIIVEGDVDKLVVDASDVPVTVKGAVDEVTVSGAKATITVEGTVGTLTTTSAATNTSIDVKEGAKVNTVNAAAAGTQVGGKGTVTSVSATANNVSVSTTGTNVTAAAGTTGVKAGDKEVNPGETAKVEEGTTTPGGGGGFPGGGSGSVAVSAISVTGNLVVGETLTATTTPTDATVTYQWMRSNTADGEYTNIAGATGKTYVVVAGDAGKYIKVKVTGTTGNYTGTPVSDARGPIEEVTPAVELNLVSVDKVETEEGYIFTVKAEGDDLGRLHVLLHTGLDASYDDIDGTSGKIEYLVLNASENEIEVYGDVDSKAKVTGFGVTASYVEATQTWTVTVNSETLQGQLGESIDLEDIGLLFYVSNQADRTDRSENIIASDFSKEAVDPEPVALNLNSVDKEETEEGYIFTVKAEGDDLGRLHVLLHTGLDASYDDIDGTSGKIEYLVLNASENEIEVYGDVDSKAKVTGFGVTASYVEATQTWTVTVNSETLQGQLGESIDLEDIGLLFYVSNQADRNVRSENIIASDFSKEAVEETP